MPEGKINAFNLGSLGVNVDKSPIHLDDGEWTSTQNAIQDHTGYTGAIRKRPGLVKFNSVALAGSVSGGMGVPLGTNGIVDTARLYVAQQDALAAAKWYYSENLFTSNTATTALAAWQKPIANLATAIDGSYRAGSILDHRLYYASTHTSGTTSPNIRVFDGVQDFELSKVLPATTKDISSIYTDHGNVYVLTLDSGTTDADWVGRVFQLDTTTGHLLQIGPAIATGYIPSTIAIHNGLVFVGTAKLTTTNEGTVYRINPLDETVWTLDDTLPNNRHGVLALASFKGLLYSGSYADGGATFKGEIRQRSVSGTWSTVDSTVDNGGRYTSLLAFGDFLYATAINYSGGNEVIRRSSDGTTWATVATTTGASLGVLQVIGKRLFAVGPGGLRYTLDGSSWTSGTMPTDQTIGGILGTLL